MLKGLRFGYRLIVILILLQVVFFIAGAVIFGIFKDEIHAGVENALGKDVLHGDSLHIGDLDYGSTLLLQPRLTMDKVQLWGLGATHLDPVFDIEQINIDLSWPKTLRMVWDATEFTSGFPFVIIRNDLVRIRLYGMHLRDGKITMHRTAKGHNHRLFRPSLEKIRKFASGELKMAGGFEIGSFTARNVYLDYLKTLGDNPNEALPKVYKVQLDELSMRLSSDSTKTYFDHFSTEGTIGAIRVKDNEGLVNRVFKASGSADLRKLTLAQKLKEDTGFDLISDNLKVEFKGLDVNASGILSTLNERMRLDIDFQSLTGTEDKSNESLLSFLELALSDRFLDVIKSYEPLGELEFDGKVFSKDNEYGGSIRIDLKYLARDTSFKFRFFEGGQKHTIDNLELDGLFQVGGETPSYISANIAEGELYPGQNFQAEIVLDNVFRREFLDSLEQLQQPPLASVKFESKDIHFKNFMEFLESNRFQNVDGTIDFEGFHFSGPIASLSKSYSELDYGGNFNVNNVSFTYENVELPTDINVEDLNGGVQFSSDAALPSISFTVNNQAIEIVDGIVSDIIPYVLNQDREQLKLDNFLLRIPDLSAKETIAEIRNMKSDTAKKQGFSLADINDLVDQVKSNINASNFRIEFPGIDLNEIYQTDSLNGFYPREFGDTDLALTTNIEDDIETSLELRSGNDLLSINTTISQNSPMQLLSNVGGTISDVSDFACRLGFQAPIGQHLGFPLALKSDFTLKVILNDHLLDVGFETEGIKISNDEMAIQAGISEFEGNFRLNLDNLKKSPEGYFNFTAQLDDELLSASLQSSRDSLIIATKGEQRLHFQTAKKYLSLFCEIDRNLSRIGNLDGQMSFSTKIEEHTGEHGIDVLMNASRLGSFDILGLSFDFLKGNDAIRFDNINANITYNDRGIKIEEFRGNYLDSDFEIHNTHLNGLLEFVLLGEPLLVDTMHIRSDVLDLATIFEANAGSKYNCEALQPDVEELPPCPSCIKTSAQESESVDPVAFSLLDFLQFSSVKYADAYIKRILFRPIPGSEIFEIDNMNGSGSLDSGLLVIDDFSADFADGLMFQYKPLTVEVLSKDKIAVSGAYTVADLELHEVIENLNNKALRDLKSDRLNFRGKLSMDFDFVDTLTSETDINSLEFRINNMQIVQGSAKELSLVGLDKKWKENVGPFQRLMAAMFLGNFKKKFNRPTRYVVNLENMILDTGWVKYDLFEFYNNQVNVISQGAYEISTGVRDIDLLLQRRIKDYDYGKAVSEYCNNGFLTYFNIQNDPEKLEIRSPSVAEIEARNANFNNCMNECPCANEDCESYCTTTFPPLEDVREVANKISLTLSEKRLKERCK